MASSGTRLPLAIQRPVRRTPRTGSALAGASSNSQICDAIANPILEARSARPGTHVITNRIQGAVHYDSFRTVIRKIRTNVRNDS